VAAFVKIYEGIREIRKSKGQLVNSLA
jgi:hypothetical protein